MVNNINKHAILPLLIIITLSFIALDAMAKSANITVTTSRNPVALDDSFHLIYEADSSVDDDPDFAPVNKNFDILSSSQSTNMRSINGSWSMKKSWDLTLIAKDVGKFTIPPVAFGSDISPAIQITVSNSSSPNSVSPDGQSSVPATIFLESDIDRKTGWVQSQFIYSVRLLRTVNITSASLTEPVTSDADAIIKKLSENQYQTTRNGIRYDVIERRYAIFPQKSGAVKINPVTFEGRVNSTQPRTIFDQFRISGQMKRLRSKAIDITVKAAPKAVNLQDWLPASKLQLIEEWSDDIQNLKAGEPVTRTITIAAEGLTGVQLPDLKFEDIENLKQYPDKAVIEDRESTAGITGLKQIKIALIPSVAGSFTLPEINLQWWNIKTGKSESAIIPQTTLSVTGNAASITATPLPAEDNTAANISAKSNQTPEDTALAPAAIIAISNQPYWMWLSLSLAIAWIVTLILLLKKSRSKNRLDTGKTAATAASLKTAASAAEKHISAKDAASAKKALIEWAKIFYGDTSISNLSLLSAHCSTQLAEQLESLNQSLYNPEKPAWDNKKLLTAFKNENNIKNSPSVNKASALKPLYSK